MSIDLPGTDNESRVSVNVYFVVITGFDSVPYLSQYFLITPDTYIITVEIKH